MKHNKAYVLDTSILMKDPFIIARLRGLVVVPTTVIYQLDGLKKSNNPNVASNAQLVSRLIDKITSNGDPSLGIALANGSTFKITHEYTKVDTLPNVSDNKIIGTAEYLKKHKNMDVILLTTDKNMRIAARGQGIKAEGIIAEKNVAPNNGIISKIVKYRSLILIGYLFLPVVLFLTEGLGLPSNTIFTSWLVGIFILGLILAILSEITNTDKTNDDDWLSLSRKFDDDDWSLSEGVIGDAAEEIAIFGETITGGDRLS